MLRLPQFCKSILENCRIDSTSRLSPSLLYPNSSKLYCSIDASSPCLDSRIVQLKSIVWGPSSSLYVLQNLSKTTSNLLRSEIQWYRSPRGNGHWVANVERCCGRRGRAIEVAVLRKSLTYGGCKNVRNSVTRLVETKTYQRLRVLCLHSLVDSDHGDGGRGRTADQ